MNVNNITNFKFTLAGLPTRDMTLETHLNTLYDLQYLCNATEALLAT